MKKNYIYPKVESVAIMTAMHVCDGSMQENTNVVNTGDTGLDPEEGL